MVRKFVQLIDFLVAQNNQRFEFHRHGETKKLKLDMNSEKIINEEERKRKSKKFKNRKQKFGTEFKLPQYRR